MSRRRIHRHYQLCRRNEIQQFDKVFRKVNFGILDPGAAKQALELA